MVEPHSGPVVVVPLPYAHGISRAYAKDQSCNFAGAGVGAALLHVLGTCQVVLLKVTPGALSYVRPLNGRTRELP